ncbi:MAG TPA: cupin domain-containing protein [Anaerolineales bacterium]|nr:cupin domain-containing protein [Anaerolineales bacterium]
MTTKLTLGTKLKLLREERGLSQRELARRAGISANSVSLIERDENSPSVSTLQSLAESLMVKMGYFFEEESPSKILLIKASQLPEISSRGTSIQGLGKRLRGQEVEPFYITLESGAGSGERQVVHSGHELVYCIKGQVEYLIDGQIYWLDAGDFLIFEAALPHLWRNKSEEPAKILLILQTPGESIDPVNRHFSNYPSISHIG